MIVEKTLKDIMTTHIMIPLKLTEIAIIVRDSKSYVRFKGDLVTRGINVVFKIDLKNLSELFYNIEIDAIDTDILWRQLCGYLIVFTQEYDNNYEVHYVAKTLDKIVCTCDIPDNLVKEENI